MKHLKHLSMLFFVVLALVLLLTPKAEAATVASGTCGAEGSDVNWVLDDMGTLTVTGTGEMQWEDPYEPPWETRKSAIKMVVIGDGVTHIGVYAFNGCKNLTSVTIGNDVEYIGKCAFYGCEKLTAVTIPDSVLEIGESAFTECFGLTAVTIGNSVNFIGTSAFSNCAKLTEIKIPDSVNGIGNMAFASCSALKNVTLGKSMYGIGSGAFWWCSALTSVVIPDSVQMIGSSAFQDCKALTSVTIGRGVETIGNEAFRACTALTEIRFNATRMEDLDHLNKVFYDAGTAGNGIWVVFGAYVNHIPACLFDANNGKNAPYITAIEFEKGCWLLSVGDNAFYNCTTIEKLYLDSWNNWCEADFGMSSNPLCYVQEIYVDGVLEDDTITVSGIWLGNRAFSGYTGIKKVEIDTQSVGLEAFLGCTNLESVTFSDRVERIKEGAFRNCAALTSLTMGSGVEYIGLNAFSSCSGLTELTLPDSVTEIGNMAFAQCEGLTSLTLGSGLKTIGPGAFSWCSSLTELTIPDSVTRISNMAFEQCTGLTVINIGQRVSYIGEAAFNGCSGLKEIYFMGLAPTFDGDIFADMNGTGDLVIATAYYRQYDGGWTDANRLNYGGEITWVPYSSTGGTCGESLSWTVSTDGVLTIVGTGAMTDWSTYTTAPWYNYRNDIKDIVIESGVTSVGRYAFYNLTQLTAVVIPNNVLVIGGSAFSGCSSLESITIPFVGESRKTSKDTYQYPFGYIFGNTSYTGGIKTKQSYYGAYTSSSTSSTYYIPETLKHVTVTGGNILWGAFDNCSGLTSVKLPNSIDAIREFSFRGCTGLETIVIPDSVSMIGQDAFSGCSGLRSVTLGSGLETMGNYVFRDCTALEEIYFNAENMSDWSSWHSNFLGAGQAGAGITVTIGSKVTRIPAYLFATISVQDTPNITNVKFEANSQCTSIGDSAFYNRIGLKKVIIPESITSIGDAAFSGCDGLTEICFNAVNMEDLPTTNYMFYRAGYSTTGIKVTIGAKVTRVPAYLFCSKSGSAGYEPKITVIEFEKGSICKSIGDYAFGNCPYLEELYYNAANVSDLSEKNGVFNGAGKSGEGIRVVIGSEVIRIPAYLFYPTSTYYSPQIIDVVFEGGNGGITIGDYAFYYCTLITDIEMPGNVAVIGTNAFGNCSKLKKIYFSGSAPAIAEKAFLYVRATAYYSYKDTSWTADVRQNYGGTIVWEAAFADTIVEGQCGTALTWKLDELGALTISGTGAMPDWSSKEATPWYAYRNDIKTVIIEDGVTKIGKFAFYEYANLASVTIGENVKSMGPYAFYKCEGLTKIQFNAINCGNLQDGDCVFAYAGQSGTGIQLIVGAKATRIPACLFCAPYSDSAQRTKLVSVSFESGSVCEEIGAQAFSYCTDLTAFNIPSSVTTIGFYAFNNCTGLTRITIPKNVTSIGTCPFRNCYNLSRISVNSNNPNYSSDGYVLFNKDRTVLLEAPCNLSGTYTIPDSVKEIGHSAFLSCNVKKVIIPDSVTSIGSQAFYFASVTEVEIGGGVAVMGSDVFGWCQKLQKVTIAEGTTTIGKSAFYSCTWLTTVTIPGSVTSVDESAFYGCTALRGVLFIGEAPAFGGSKVFSGVNATAYYPINFTGWTEEVRQNYGGTITWEAYSAEKSGLCGTGVRYELDDNGTLRIFKENATRNALQGMMTSTPWKLLYGDQIKKIVIEEGVVSIAEGAFDGCSNLETVTVAKTVENIGSKAFANCTNLKSVTFEGSAPTVDNTVFEGTDTTIYYPAEDDTWDDDIKENIGNATVLVPVGGTQKPEKFDIDVARMILGNSLEFQFGVAKSKFTDMTGVYAVIEKQWPDGTTTIKTIPASQWGTAGQYWAIVYDELAAKEMADALSVTIYNAQGEAISNTKTDSARSYVMRSLGGQTAKGKTMMVDMLNYGAAAQTHFNYNIGDLANNQLTEEQKAWGTQIMKTVTNNLVTGTNYKGTRLVLEGRIQMQVAFTGMNRSMYAVYSYTNHNGKSCTVTVRGADMIEVGNLLGVELSELVYADARQVVTIEIYNENGTLISTVKDSMESYIKRSGSSSALNQALMKFADSAKVYLHQ